MTTRIIVAATLTLLLGFLTVQAYSTLRDSEHARVALFVETESYATRSRLVGRVDALLDALRDAHDYWAENVAAPAEEWEPYQGASLEAFDGLLRLLWVDEDGGRRYLRTESERDFDREPSAEHHAISEAMRGVGAGVDGETMLAAGGDDDHQLRVVINRSGVSGFLVADIDTQALLDGLLGEESPGYALAVHWRGQTLYQRDEPAQDIPSDWAREGLIRTSMDSLLRVVHTPTSELAATLPAPVLVAVIPLGFAVSGLLGLLVYENGRVNVRADAARQAETQIAELNRGLEQEVAARTRELASRNADLVTISESITHDLRSPLNALAMNLELIGQEASERLAGEEYEAFERSRSAVRQMAGIIERVVGLSMATHATFERERLAMSALVREVFEQLHAAEPPPPVKLELDELPDIDADDRLVRILVLNLLSNSLRHTREQSERVIRVSSYHEGCESVFCFRDNGPGFDLDMAQRLFEPFTQGDDVGEGSTDGVGLGLAIVARVVDRHGGRIWADSRDATPAIHLTLAPSQAR